FTRITLLTLGHRPRSLQWVRRTAPHSGLDMEIAAVWKGAKHFRDDSPPGQWAGAHAPGFRRPATRRWRRAEGPGRVVAPRRPATGSAATPSARLVRPTPAPS